MTKSNIAGIELNKEQLYKLLFPIYPDNPITKDHEYRLDGGKLVINEKGAYHFAEGKNHYEILKDHYNLTSPKEIRDKVNILLGLDQPEPLQLEVVKPQEKSKEKIVLSKNTLRIFHQTLTEYFLNDTKNKELYTKLYQEKRQLNLTPDFIPLLPSYKAKFKQSFPNEYKELLPVLGGFDYYLIQFHRDINNNIDYFTGYLFEDIFKKYYSHKSKEDYKKSKKPFNVSSSIYGRQSLIKEDIKDNIIIVSESVDKSEALIQLGYSSIGLNGITNYKAFQEALNEIETIIRAKDLELVILLDSKQKIHTNEVQSNRRLCKIALEKNIKCSIATLTKPSLNSDTKDIDINDLFLNKSDKARLKEIKIVLTSRLSLEDYNNKLALNTNDSRKDLFKTAIRPAIGVKQLAKKELITIDDIRNKGLILKDIKESLSDKTIKNILVKAPAGSGKTHSIKELSKEYKILFLTNNNNLLEDFIKENKGLSNKIHYEKSYSQLCKENHQENNINLEDPKTNYKKFTSYTAKGLNTKKVCKDCPLKKSCKTQNKSKPTKYKLENETSIVMMTLDNYMKQSKDTKELLENFAPELICIDESFSLVNDLQVNEQELKSIKNYIINRPECKDNIKKLYRLLATIFEDTIKTQINFKGNDLYNYYNKNYNGFKQAFKNQTIDSIEESIKALELEDYLDGVENLPNTKILPEFLRATKNKLKNVVKTNEGLTIFAKKELLLPPGKTTIFFDATGNSKLLARKLDIKLEDIKQIDYLAYNPNLIIKQYIDKSSKASGIEKFNPKYNNIIELAKSKLIEDKKVLLIAPKKTEISFKEDSNLKQYIDSKQLAIEHHYSLRGINEFKDYDVCLITSPKINHDSLEARAFSEYGIAKANLELKTIQSNIYNPYSKTYMKLENTKVYDDNFMNIVLENYAAAEIYQCIKRIDRKGNEQKEIYILDQNDMSNFIHEKIELLNLAEIRNKKKPKSDNILKLLLNFFKANKENNINCFSQNAIHENFLEFIKDSEKIKKSDFSIQQTLMNSTYSTNRNNIYYNPITIKPLCTNDKAFPYLNLESFNKLLNEVASKIGMKQKTIALFLDGKQATKIKFFYFNDFDSMENLLHETFHFKIPIQEPKKQPLQLEVVKSNNIAFTSEKKHSLDSRYLPIDLFNKFVGSIASNSIYKEDYQYFFEVGENHLYFYNHLIKTNYFNDCEILKDFEIYHKLAFDVLSFITSNNHVLESARQVSINNEPLEMFDPNKSNIIDFTEKRANSNNTLKSIDSMLEAFCDGFDYRHFARVKHEFKYKNPLTLEAEMIVLYKYRAYFLKNNKSKLKQRILANLSNLNSIEYIAFMPFDKFLAYLNQFTLEKWVYRDAYYNLLACLEGELVNIC